METSNASKEDVLAVLRELTRATKRHAHFVDRLISVVSERAPWMMEELSALQDASELPDPAAAVPAAGAACGGGVNAPAPSPTAVTLLPPSPPSSPPPQQQQQKQQQQQQQQTPSSQQAKDSEAERIIVV
ncbi:uncharacterized protein LOC143274780 [Babylonia areolata]|uniref:uncharacterized protein LOC143274780 n=1 Tax=Babylonia areolata TaxID=304850 RepID=UPI003FD4C251